MRITNRVGVPSHFASHLLIYAANFAMPTISTAWLRNVYSNLILFRQILATTPE